MPTLIERERQVVSAVSDDFFEDDTVLYYLNKSQDKIVSILINQERNQQRSLRALDNLRIHDEVSIEDSFADEGDYYSVQVPFPSSNKINQFNYLSWGDTVLREITQNNLIKLKYGNLRPSQSEGYYLVTQDNDGKVFELYLPEEDDTSKLNIFYVAEPTPLEENDEQLPELSSQLENAVIYGAAVMMSTQESVKDPQNQTQLFYQIYQDELSSSLY